MRPITLLLMAIALALPAPAAAQGSDGSAGDAMAEGTPSDPTPEQRERALDLFEQAEGAYREGDFAAAVELLVEARSLYEAPVLLYNLARAYEGLAELDRALEAYRQYLEEQPDAPDRGAIERRIDSLRSQIDERDRLAAESEQRERQLTAERARARRAEEERGPGAWPYVVLGAGAVLLAGGAGTGTAALLLRDDAAADPEHRGSRETFRTAELLATTANVLFVAGGVIAAAGLTWILVSLGGDEETDPNLAVRLGPTGLGLDGRF